MVDMRKMRNPYLGARKTILGPTKWMGVLVEQSVLLLNPEPGVLVLGLLHDLLARLPVVRVGWLLVVFVGFAHHQNVVTCKNIKEITNKILEKIMEGLK